MNGLCGTRLIFFSIAQAVFVPPGVCVNSWMPWNWGSKPRPIDGQWSSWSSWSTCQMTFEPIKTPFRYKERGCSNPAPKNGGDECKGESRRTTSCDDCNIALGLESGRIKDSMITALHSHKDFPASAARLNGKSAWCSMNPDSLLEPLYLQIDLKKMTAISAIASQGFYPAAELLSLRMGRVSKYELMYSTNGFAWKLYQDRINKTVIRGNSRRNGTALNILTPEITARFIRVYPLSYFSFVCMRLELYGCTFGCGGDLSVEPGNIITQSSPQEDQDCLWHVKLPNITKLNFDFINFNVPCSNGYTELRDGSMPYSTATVLAQYCGFDRPPPLVMSNSGEFWVRFKSNASDPQVGFYSVYFPGCGGHLHGSTGEIKSPNFPKEYFHNSKCIWTITVQEGKSLRLNFVQFSIEGDANRQRCPHDHLTIWNGSHSNAPLIGKYCNSNPPPSVVCSSGNSVRLKFHSDDALAWSGFFITYSAVNPFMPCNEMFSSTIMPTNTSLWTTSMYLTPTPLVTVMKTVITQQAMFSSRSHFYVGSTTKITVDRTNLNTLALSSANVTVDFEGTSADGELKAAAQGKRKYDGDDDDDESLTTVIILSVMAFIVICMIIASIIPSVKHHYEKQKQETEMSLMTAASLSIPETNSKETFEVVPTTADLQLTPALDRVPCDAVSYSEPGLLPVEIAESESLSETPTVEFSNEPLEITRLLLKSSGIKNICEDENVGLGTGENETDAMVPFIMDDDAQEIGSLRMSYEDLGSSFACEMQAMLSQLVDKDELPEWNHSIVNDETETEGSIVSEREACNDNVPQGQGDTKSIQLNETSTNNVSFGKGEKLLSTLNKADIEMGGKWKMEPVDNVSCHSLKKTAGNERISGSQTDSKDSSSSENASTCSYSETYV